MTKCPIEDMTDAYYAELDKQDAEEDVENMRAPVSYAPPRAYKPIDWDALKEQFAKMFPNDPNHKKLLP